MRWLVVASKPTKPHSSGPPHACARRVPVLLHTEKGMEKKAETPRLGRMSRERAASVAPAILSSKCVSGISYCESSLYM